MISDAIIIGAVNAAIYRDNNALKAMRLEHGQVLDCTRDIALLLDCHAEKRHISPAPNSTEQLGKTLKFWSQRHQVFNLLLIGLDSVCSSNTRALSIATAEQELSNRQLHDFVQARLLGCVLPDSANLTEAMTLTEPHTKIAALYNQLNDCQDIISPIRRLLQNLLLYEFAGDYDAEQLMRLLVDHGLVATTVLAVNQNDKSTLENLSFQFQNTAELKALPRLTHFLTLFKSRVIEEFAITNKPIVTVAKAEFTKTSTDPIELAITSWLKINDQDTDTKRQKLKKSAKATLDDIKKQKAYILTLLQQRKQDKAEKAILDLVHNQQKTGKITNLCQSLCDLANRVKSIGLEAYALDLYDYAKLANSKDVVCYTGYAETLRALGRNDDALAVYDQARQQFSHDAVCHTGYAETLRALGRNDDALEAYVLARQEFPNDRIVKNAMACLLIETGDPETAKSLLSNQKPENHEDWRDYHVLAMLNFNNDDMTEAEEMFRHGSKNADYTNKKYFKIGLSLLLLKQNQPELALEQIDMDLTNIIAFPESALISAHALAKSNRLNEAEERLESLSKANKNIIQISDYLNRRYLTRTETLDAVEIARLDKKIEQLEFSMLLRAA